MRTSRRHSLLLVAGTALLVAVPAAQAAPPPNDSFAAAQAIAGESGTVAGTTAEATKEPGERAHGGNAGGRSVWYRWTAPYTGTALFETCGGELDTLLAVYTGTAVSSLGLVGENDDECGEQSRVAATVSTGTVYSIVVDGFNGAAGAFTLRWSRVLSPANDDFDAAEPLTGTSGRRSGTTLGATRQPGEPTHGPESGGHSVWYSLTPTRNGNALVETCGSEFDTLLAVYTGTALTALTARGRNDDRCGLASRLIIPVRAGTTYRIAIDSVGNGGTFAITWRVATPPRNDRFRAARSISGRGGSVAGTNVVGSKEAREPAHAGNAGGASVWYRWRAPASIRIVFRTCGTSLDTVLAVYRGSSLARLRRVASDDDDCPEDTASLVVFRARRGTVYRIAVDGFNGAIGSFRLRWARRR